MFKWIISIHAPTGGATEQVVQLRMYTLYFNPRSHGGSDSDSEYFTRFERISIHAPTGGATFLSFYIVNMFHVFQSTLPRGERPNFSSVSPSSTEFQSTLPRGERRMCITPPKLFSKFQSTLPRGERRLSGLWHDPHFLLFQSTLPRGERQYINSCSNSTKSYFNPRSHGGSDESDVDY